MSITRVPVAHRSPVFALGTVREAGDRWRIFTVGDDERIRSWDAATGVEEEFSMPAQSYTMRSLVGADVGDSRLLVWASRDTIQRVDRGSGVAVGDRIRVNAVGGIAVAGELIVAASSLGVLSRWDLRTGEPVGEPLTGHEGAVTSVAATMLPDGRPVIVSGGADRTVRRWDAMSGEPLGPPMQGHRGPVEDVCCTGSLIVSQARGGATRRWDAATGERIGRPLNQPAPYGSAGGLAVTSDGRVLYSVDGTRALNRWDEDDSPRRLSGPFATVDRLAMAGDMLVSATEQGVIRRWDRSGREIGSPLTGHPASVQGLTVVAGGPPTVVSTGPDGVRAWDVETGDPFADQTADPISASLGFAGVWLGDGRLIVASFGGMRLRRHDVVAGTQAVDPPADDEADDVKVTDVAAVALPDGAGLIVATTTRGEVLRFDAATGMPAGGTRLGGGVVNGHGNEWFAVAATMLSDGTVMIAAVGESNQIQRWNAMTGEPIGAPLDSPGLVLSMTFQALPDAVLLVSCTDSGLVQRWNAATGNPVGEILSVKTGPSVPFVPAAVDADRLIAASYGGRTRCWDGATGDHLGDIAGGGCSAVLTLPDGRVVLVVGNEDGSLEFIRMRPSLEINVDLPLRES